LTGRLFPESPSLAGRQTLREHCPGERLRRAAFGLVCAESYGGYWLGMEREVVPRLVGQVIRFGYTLAASDGTRAAARGSPPTPVSPQSSLRLVDSTLRLSLRRAPPR